MHPLAAELTALVAHAAPQLRAISEARSQVVRVDGQWTAKQVLGHLIDSAANNHQRFVRAQFTDDLVFQGYDQEQWVLAQRYDQQTWAALVALWEAYNLHLAHVIAHIPENLLAQPRARHSLDRIAWQLVPADQPATLEYLIRDYFGHLQAHLAQLSAAAGPV